MASKGSFQYVERTNEQRATHGDHNQSSLDHALRSFDKELSNAFAELAGDSNGRSAFYHYSSTAGDQRFVDSIFSKASFEPGGSINFAAADHQSTQQRFVG